MNPLEVLLWVVAAYVAVAATICVVAGYLAWNTLDPAARYKHYQTMQWSPVWPLALIGAFGTIRRDYARCKDASAEQQRRELIERLGHLEKELEQSAKLNESAAQAWQRIEQKGLTDTELPSSGIDNAESAG